MSLDVTPVGGAPGSRAASGVAPAGGPAPDPFGSRPSVRRRGWVRICAGAVLVLAGAVAAVAGIVTAVRDHAALSENAVARGTVGETVRFAHDGAGRSSFSVYLSFDGVENNTTDQELAVRDTACVATGTDGAQARFRGARQGTSVVLGGSASVGHFSVPPGAVSIRCAYTSGTRSSRRRRPDRVPYVVTPGTPSSMAGGVGLIVGGTFGSLLGGWALWSGWRGRRRPVR